MTQPLSVWFKAALPQLPGAVRSVVRGELTRTIREFYELSTCLRETVERDVAASISAYEISPSDASTLVLHLLEVYYNGRKLGVLKQKPVRPQTATSPTGWYRTGIRTVNLYPTPTVDLASGISVYLTLRPDTDNDTVPDISRDEHFEPIMDGLMGRMQKHPAKPYTNLQLSQYHLQRLRNHIGLYKGLANKGNVPTGVGWTFERFGK